MVLESIMNSLLSLVEGPMSPAKVEASLSERRLKQAPEATDYNNSIVDLLKVLGLDSSLGARKSLAKELRFPGEYVGTAEQNVWLHHQVMEQVAHRHY